jgi:hypothetical protein
MKRPFVLILAASLFFCGCHNDRHFISDTTYRQKVSLQFEKQKALAQERSDALFSVFKQSLSNEESEAMEFLYAFMPLSDLADYNGEFFLRNVRTAFKSRDNFSWGKQIPEDVFRHFVLPYRVNNENLDSAREVFYNELKDRVKNLSMKDAALEVNHWCHEKVNYRGTDIRTSAPLSTVKNGFGRCGEESTFTVTAMRSVGIPSRQIYTPRWAHCDDNHAWVEVWIDGKWYFLGACEPEPDLNMGWFAVPATRAMLLHTRVYGQYQGTDDVVTKDDRYTEINVIPAYAPAKRVYVKVENPNKTAARKALVEFKLYNYAEFYSISKATTDSSGICSLLTGYGDLLIWASKDGLVSYKKISVGSADTVVLPLDKPNFQERTESYDIVPPVPGKVAEVSEKGREENSKRLKYEDELRLSYEKTFIDSAAATNLAQKLKLSPDSVWKILHTSRGNWKEITAFLETASPELRSRGLQLMFVISEKDHHDTPKEVLADHLNFSNYSQGLTSDLFKDNVLNPRIANELLSSYKAFFQEKFDLDFIQHTQKDIHVLLTWINEHIKIDDQANTSRVPLKPRGVYELKYADKLSRDIFFVAVCRSFGIPARLEESRSIPQYFNTGWHDVYFETNKLSDQPKGQLTLNYLSKTKELKPEYYTHFTIGRFDGSRYKTLDFEFSNAFASFPAKLTVDTGRYVLITGVRLQDGSVLSLQKYFSVSANKNAELRLEFREKPVISKNGYGTIPLDQEFDLYNTTKKKRINEMSSTAGMVIVWIDPDKEPTKHLMSDIQKLKSNFDQWSGSIFFLVKPDRTTLSFAPANYPDLPTRNEFAADKGDYLSVVEKAIKQKFNNNFPIVLVVDQIGKVVYYSSGYKIGNGEQIVKQIEEMKPSKPNQLCKIKH